MEQRLSLVTLGVRDLDRARAFYEALGWQRTMREAEGVAFFQLNGIGLSLYPRTDFARDAGVDPADAALHPSAGRMAGAHPAPSWTQGGTPMCTMRYSAGGVPCAAIPSPSGF